MRAGAGSNFFYAFEMVNFVLWHRNRPAGDVGPEQCAGDTTIEGGKFFVSDPVGIISR